MNDCLFCKIAAGEIPSKKVMETDGLFAFEDINPVAPVHILIVPKKHIESNRGLTAEDICMIGEIHLMANEIARKRGIDLTGYRMLTNTGEAAGQAVFHLHFHLLGGRRFAWPPG